MCFSPQRRAIFRHRNFKNGPKLTCFVHSHLKMCFSPQRRAIFRHRNFKKWSKAHSHLKMRFSPQRRAIFRHRNFKKWSEADVFCTFSLENVLLATAACNFSTSELQKVVRSCTWKCASGHSSVQFFDIGTSKKCSETLNFLPF